MRTSADDVNELEGAYGPLGGDALVGDNYWGGDGGIAPANNVFNHQATTGKNSCRRPAGIVDVDHDVSTGEDIRIDDPELTPELRHQRRLIREVEASLFSCIAGTRTSGGRWTIEQEEDRVLKTLSALASSLNEHLRYAYVCAPQSSGCPHTHYLVEGPMSPEFQAAVHGALRAGDGHSVPYVASGGWVPYMARHVGSRSLANIGVACPGGPECVDGCIRSWDSPMFLNPGRYQISTLGSEIKTGRGVDLGAVKVPASLFNAGLVAQQNDHSQDAREPRAEIQIEAKRVREVVRLHCKGTTVSTIMEKTGLGRGTYLKLVKVLGELHLLNGEADRVPSTDTIERALEPYRPRRRPQQTSKLAAYRGTVEAMLVRGDSALTITNQLNAIYPEAGASRASVRRLVDGIRADWATQPSRNIQGSTATVDVKALRGIINADTGEVRDGYVYVMSVDEPAMLFAAHVLDLKPSTWIDLHEEAFRSFGGVPHRIQVTKDASAAARTFTSAIGQGRTDALTYRDLAGHYGFEVVPCSADGRTGPCAADVLASLGADRTDLAICNSIDAWVQRTKASRSSRLPPGQKLQPLAKGTYNRVLWKAATVHPDGHVEFDASMYSVPRRFVFMDVLLATTENTVTIVHGGQTIATHDRLRTRGSWSTDPVHVEGEASPGQLQVAREVQYKASRLGSEVGTLISRVRESGPLHRTLREMQKIVRHFEQLEPQNRRKVAQRVTVTGKLTYRSAKRLTRDAEA